MTLRVYNALTRKKDEFKSLHKGKVGLYSCGPTVYWYQHIGNLRTYIFSDILKRVLMYNGYKVKHVMNVTDVGHLTSDADTGEDKIEKAAKNMLFFHCDFCNKESPSYISIPKEALKSVKGKNYFQCKFCNKINIKNMSQLFHKKITAEEISKHYWKIFKQDFGKLNIIEPDVWPRATEHIKEQIELIKKLEKEGYTYKTSDGIYFNTAKFKDYGKLARLDIKSLKAGKRISVGEKKNKTDFALWKFSKGEKRQQEWKSPWGVGFPGWHVECSAMSMKYLGDSFDIHTGGLEHIPIHHTNEIAQSEAVTGKKFVNYWIHAGWLLFKGEKVSKSKGGLYTISELEKKGFAALDFRYLCLTTHYKKPLSFDLDKLKKAQESYQRLKNIISEIKKDKGLNKKYLKEFEKAINDDLNMPDALQVLWKLVRDKNAKGKIGTIKKMDEIFGLELLKKEKLKIPEKVQKLIKEREKFRKKKDFKRADEIRNKIKSLGYYIDDTGKGAKVRKE